MLLPRRATVLTKSDCPGQSANHQTPPFFCSFSQPDSSHQPSIQQMRLIRTCPCPAGLPIPTPAHPSAPLKTFSQQTRLARVCPARVTAPTKPDCPGQSANHQTSLILHLLYPSPPSPRQLFPTIHPTNAAHPHLPQRVKLYLPQNHTHKSAIFPRHCHSKPTIHQAPTGACPAG